MDPTSESIRPAGNGMVYADTVPGLDRIRAIVRNFTDCEMIVMRTPAQATQDSSTVDNLAQNATTPTWLDYDM